MNFLINKKLFVMAVGFALMCSTPLVAKAASKAAWTGIVTHVVDGDTVRIRTAAGKKPASIRISGIDAPEICQMGGVQARDALRRRVLGKQVVLQGKVRDNYGRLVARIFLNNQDQGQWLVAQGLAWSYRYRNNAGPYILEQNRAYAAALGMFGDKSAAAPVYPREFRKRHGSCYVRHR